MHGETTIVMSKKNPHQFKDKHYNGIATLQKWYGSKISITRKKSTIALYQKCIEYLTEMKKKQFYSKDERTQLNRIRQHYQDFKDL
jgi:hypothetical protein